MLERKESILDDLDVFEEEGRKLADFYSSEGNPINNIANCVRGNNIQSEADTKLMDKFHALMIEDAVQEFKETVEGFSAPNQRK